MVSCKALTRLLSNNGNWDIVLSRCKKNWIKNREQKQLFNLDFLLTKIKEMPRYLKCGLFLMIFSWYSVEWSGAFRHKDADTPGMQTAVKLTSSLVIRCITDLWRCSVVTLLHSGVSSFVYLKYLAFFADVHKARCRTVL